MTVLINLILDVFDPLNLSELRYEVICLELLHQLLVVLLLLIVLVLDLDHEFVDEVLHRLAGDLEVLVELAFCVLDALKKLAGHHYVLFINRRFTHSQFLTKSCHLSHPRLVTWHHILLRVRSRRLCGQPRVTTLAGQLTLVLCVS